MEAFVSSSNTMYLSLGLRPVCVPVSAQSAPPDVSSASPREIANSYNSGSIRFQCTARAPPRPNFSTPYAKLRIPCSNIEILLAPDQPEHLISIEIECTPVRAP